MSRNDQTVWCTGCGTEISWMPILENNHYYCCQDCADNLFCECGYEVEADDNYLDSSSKESLINFAS